LELHHQLVEVERVGVEVLAEAGRLGDATDVDFELLGEVLADNGQDFFVGHRAPNYDVSAGGTPASAPARALRLAPPSRSSAAVRPTASTSAQRAASRTALAIPSAPELPWPTTAIPRRPSRIAPPVVSGCSSRRSPPSAGFISRPPAAASGLERAALRIAPAIARAEPSITLRVTLPVKPSVTITSTVAAGRSPPSTLPANSIPGASLSSRFASTTSSRPLP